jgi:putative ABC transport system ATP-binding protein
MFEKKICEDILMNAVEVKDLVKEYGQGDVKVRALDGVNLAIEKGSFVAITGESGSGKSTLANIISCMDKPTSGSVFIEGEKVGTDDASLSKIRGEKVGMIFQAFHLLPMLTAKENILMPGSFAGKKIEAGYVDVLLDNLALKDRATHLPSELSGGQQQRVAIGRALINKPGILIADEPTGNLDKKNSEAIMELLIELKNKYNMTLIVVTHSEKIAAQAERHICMEDGRIVKDEIRNN